MQDEALDRQAVDLAIDAAEKASHLAPGDPLDRLAESSHRRVLKEDPHVSNALEQRDGLLVPVGAKAKGLAALRAGNWICGQERQGGSYGGRWAQSDRRT